MRLFHRSASARIGTPLLLGATTAPTDAAGVAVILRLSGAQVPARVVMALKVESGLNDPMSVSSTMALAEAVTMPHGIDVARALLLFLVDRGGGTIVGLSGCSGG